MERFNEEIQRGRRVTINCNVPDNDYFNRLMELMSDYGIAPRVKYNTTQPFKELNKKVINEHTLPLTLIYDLPFVSGKRYLINVSDYANSDNYVIIKYGKNVYKISNFTNKRGSFYVTIKRTKCKGFLTEIK